MEVKFTEQHELLEIVSPPGFAAAVVANEPAAGVGRQRMGGIALSKQQKCFPREHPLALPGVLLGDGERGGGRLMIGQLLQRGLDLGQ